MVGQHLGQGLETGQHALAETPLAELRFHDAAAEIPLRLGGLAAGRAAVGHDLHVAIRQQQVDQHAVVVDGVPDAERAEHFDRALSRRQAAQHVRQGQRVLDGNANLAAMTRLTGLHGLLDGPQRLLGKPRAHRQRAGVGMTPEPREALHHHLPDEPPPPKLPPPPLKPPPPPRLEPPLPQPDRPPPLVETQPPWPVPFASRNKDRTKAMTPVTPPMKTELAMSAAIRAVTSPTESEAANTPNARPRACPTETSATTPASRKPRPSRSAPESRP